MTTAERAVGTESTVASTKKVSFVALREREFRFFFVTTMLAMMADNIEHVVSYWLLFQKFHSPVLAGFADISHWTPFLLLSVYFGGVADRYDCRKVIQIAQVMFMGVSAQTKAMIDRCQCLWARKYVLKIPPLSKERERKGLFISVGGRKVASLFEPALVTVKAWFNTLNIIYAGDLLFSQVDEKGSIIKHPDALRQAFLAGQRLVE